MVQKKSEITQQRRFAFKEVPDSVQWAAIIASVLGLIFVSPFFGVILFSALVAYIFNPLYLRVLRRTKRQSLAIGTAIVAATLSVLIPLTFVIGITVQQANTLVDTYNVQSGSLNSQRIDELINQGTDRFNKVVTSIPGGESLEVKKEDLVNGAKNAASKALNGFVNMALSASGAITGLITSTILALFLISSMLRYQRQLLDFVRKISPFHEQITNSYFDQAGAMTRAMVKGQLVIAIVQGLLSAVSLWMVGLDYFSFFLVLLTFLSFIPLGAGIVTIPIGIIYIATGNWPQGIFLIAWHLLVVTNIDNFLRPRLVPKNARLDQSLLLLSVFAGIPIFGPAGVIYGPVVMILLVATLRLYAEYNKDAEKPNI